MKSSIYSEFHLSPATEPGRIAEGKPAFIPDQLLDLFLPPAPPVLLTKLWLKEMDGMKDSFRMQLRNVVAVQNYLQKTKGNRPIEVLLPGISGFNESLKQGLSFKLTGSQEAFGLFVSTLFQQSYRIYSRSQVKPEINTLTLFIAGHELAALEAELSVLFEALTSIKYIAVILQWQSKNHARQRTAC